MASPMSPESTIPTATEKMALVAEFHQLLEAGAAVILQRMKDPVSGRIVLNSDDTFKILPRYELHPEDRLWLGSLLYQAAREFTDRIYADLTVAPPGADDTVVFTAGGSAVGKTTILRTAGRKAKVDFVVDTTFSNLQRGLDQVHRALNSGRKVEVHYVYREYAESVVSMIRRALDPKSGRVVPIDDMARTHFGAQRSILAVLERYAEEPRVLVELWENTDGKLRKMTVSHFAAVLHASIDVLSKQGQSILDDFREEEGKRRSSPDHHYDPGGGILHFSRAFYEAARSHTERTR